MNRVLFERVCAISRTPSQRFRGYLPVVVDLETAGLNPRRNALLQVGVVTLAPTAGDFWRIDNRYQWDVQAHPETKIDPNSLLITGINPDDPARVAKTEKEALSSLFKVLKKALERGGFERAVMVAHNASFDLSFLMAAVSRNKLEEACPFHPFTVLDTASLASLLLGHNVLAKACERAGVPFDKSSAHNALYDADRTAHLFCRMVNLWNALIGAGNEAGFVRSSLLEAGGLAKLPNGG